MKQLTEISTPFAKLSDENLPGQQSEWLQQLRQSARNLFERQGLPSKKEEDWKYTSLWELAQQQFTHQAPAPALNLQQVGKLTLVDEAYRIVIVDGQFRLDLSCQADPAQGVSISPISAVMDNTYKRLGEQIDLEKPGFNALNTMLMNEGVCISVSENTQLGKPIEIIVINSGTTDKLAVHLRHLIELQPGSEATVIEHYVSLADNSGLTNVICEVELAEHASLNHFKLQHEAMHHYHIATLAARQAANSSWYTHNISLGAKLARNDLHSRLSGERAHVGMNGLYLVKAEQHVDNHTRIDHLVGNTSSEELYKGVLDGQSHAVFNGKVIVHQHAQKTDASQNNRNLLLSRQCEIDSKPEMEIYADDVKCSHGSTVGQLDEDQLFALRTRGLDKNSARNLLTYAFAVDVLQRIENNTIRQALAGVIEQALPQGF